MAWQRNFTPKPKEANLVITLRGGVKHYIPCGREDAQKHVVTIREAKKQGADFFYIPEAINGVRVEDIAAWSYYDATGKKPKGRPRTGPAEA